ncbi:hypothetical protein WDK40_13605, partial [Escherichia coli]
FRQSCNSILRCPSISDGRLSYQFSSDGYIRRSVYAYGGCGSVKHWVTLNLAKDLGLPWCVFLDSDIGGDPAQVLSIQKRKKEVEEAGKVFFATRKREIENYLCPDLIEEITGVAVTFTDTCDAKKIIGRAVGMKPDNVLDKFWPQMTSERIISRSTYHDGTQERSELVEILSDIVSMTR